MINATSNHFQPLPTTSIHFHPQELSYILILPKEYNASKFRRSLVLRGMTLQDGLVWTLSVCINERNRPTRIRLLSSRNWRPRFCSGWMLSLMIRFWMLGVVVSSVQKNFWSFHRFHHSPSTHAEPLQWQGRFHCPGLRVFPVNLSRILFSYSGGNAV
jgi:hypothetical protein